MSKAELITWLKFNCGSDRQFVEIELGLYEKLNFSGGKCPKSPIVRTDTYPSRLTTIHVIDVLARLKRNQA